MVTILQAMKQARSNLEIEGVIIPKEQEELIKKRLKGEISEPVYIKAVLEMVKKWK
ncbi:hypothetical protein AAGG74_17625 [Bacillus mexicanus]|uniref:hypothetical protein n=1 Tax=Bacillus mexicanus TaxID=2834415 RepID=UPI003D1E143E